MSNPTYQVIGVYRTGTGSKQAIDELVRQRFDLNRISILLTDKTRVRWMPGLKSGSQEMSRGAFGAVAVGLVPVGYAASRDVVLAAGPLREVLAAASQAGRHPLQRLAGLGLTPQAVSRITDRIERGSIVVAVQASSQLEVSLVQSVFRRICDIDDSEMRDAG